jgi:hypothetical protein
MKVKFYINTLVKLTNGEEDDNLVKLVNLMERKSIKYKNDLNFN